MKIITYNQLCEFNLSVCIVYGTVHSVISESAAKSALSVQDNNYYGTEDLLASAVFRSIIMNHAFRDGNKRTAIIALVYMTGKHFEDGILYETAVDIATGKLSDVYEIAAKLFKY